MIEALKLYPPLKEVLAFGSYPQKVDAFYKFDRGINKTNMFGDNVKYYKQGVGLVNGHNGLDIACRAGAEIVTSHSGWVFQEFDDARDPSGGFGVIIVSDEPIRLKDGSESYIKTIYWHNKKNLVEVKDNVKIGQVIALADNTGFSTGNHLHFGLKKCDKQGNTLDWNNGHYGAIDPYPYIQYWDLNSMKDEILIDDELLELLYEFGFNRKPETDYWKGKSVVQFLKDAISQPEHKRYITSWKLGNLIIQFFKRGGVSK